ncbi:MAG: hypothetical protein ACK5NA_02190 [Enterococcus sp.]
MEDYEKKDGEYGGLGMIAGILIGLAMENLLFGLMIGVVIGIAMDWGDNLYHDYLMRKK